MLFDGDLPFRSRGTSLALEIADCDAPLIRRNAPSADLASFFLSCLQRDRSRRATL